VSVERLDKLDGARVAVDGEIEAAESIARQTVGAALKHHGLRIEKLHHGPNDGLKNGVVAVVVDSVVERHVHRVVFALSDSHVLHISRSGEEITILAKDF
jgi:hypothetical protein